MAVDRSKYYGYQNNYLKEHYKTMVVRMSNDYDADIIEYIEEAKSKGISVNALFKDGIRLIMEKDATK